MAPAKHSNLALYRRLLAEARPYWGHVAGVLALSLLAAPLALLMPLPLKIVVDHVLAGRRLPGYLRAVLPAGAGPRDNATLWAAVALVVAVALFSAARALAAQLLSTWTGERLLLDFRARLLRHVQRLSLAYHDATGTADSVYRIQYDAPAIQWVLIQGLIPFVSSAVTVVGMFYVTARISGRLALVALAVAPVLMFVSHFYSRRLRERYHEISKLDSRSMAVVQEGLSAVRVVKAFSREAHEHDRFVSQSQRGLGARLRAVWEENVLGLLVGLTTAAGTAAVMLVGARLVRAEALTLGDLLLVMSYLAQLYAPLKTLSTQITSQQKSLASAERAFTLLDEAPEVLERPHAKPLRRAAGAVAFHGVGFAYEPGHPILRGVTFDVPAGTRVGVAGRTGAGKTTLVNLLCRFYDPQEGRVLLDGTDLRDYRLADLRNQFSIVLQEPVLFSTSIAENIAYARPGATEAEIVAAAQAADAHDFIGALPDGYQTLVGERGMRLSGGERQRISLARAFLKDAPVLILDEPTSSVDVQTEAAIMAAMRRLMAGRTTFMIAHRLGTLAACDVVLKLEDGRVTVAKPADLLPGVEVTAPVNGKGNGSGNGSALAEVVG